MESYNAAEEEERIEEEKGHQASSLSQREQANPESEEVEGDQEGETEGDQTSREQENNQLKHLLCVVCMI